MKIVVVGATGLIGWKLVNILLRLGHTVIPASPHTGINTFTGEGIHHVLDGADVVVDVSNSPSFEDKTVLEYFQRSTMNLLAKAAYSSVGHHIILSVVGAERLHDSAYYRARLQQEELVKDSGIPYSILRSTPLFERARRIVEAATVGEEVFISPAPFQPVAAIDVVSVLKDLVLGAPLNATVEVAGPVLMPMYEFIRYFLNATEDSRQLVMDEHALYFGAEINDESLIPGEAPLLGKTKYEDWFKSQLIEHRFRGI